MRPRENAIIAVAGFAVLVVVLGVRGTWLMADPRAGAFDTRHAARSIRRDVAASKSPLRTLASLWGCRERQRRHRVHADWPVSSRTKRRRSLSTASDSVFLDVRSAAF
jgi:hypothetical protein